MLCETCRGYALSDTDCADIFVALQRLSKYFIRSAVEFTDMDQTIVDDLEGSLIVATDAFKARATNGPVLLRKKVSIDMLSDVTIIGSVSCLKTSGSESRFQTFCWLWISRQQLLKSCYYGGQYK